MLGEIEAGLLEVGELRGPLFQILPHLLVGGWRVLGSFGGGGGWFGVKMMVVGVVLCGDGEVLMMVVVGVVVVKG